MKLAQWPNHEAAPMNSHEPQTGVTESGPDRLFRNFYNPFAFANPSTQR